MKISNTEQQIKEIKSNPDLLACLISIPTVVYDIAKPKTTYPMNDIAVTIPMYGSCATA